MKDKDWGKYIKYIEPRMQKLEKNGQFLEAVSFMSVILERELIDIISHCERVINQSKDKKQNLYFCMERLQDKEKMTLGRLKKYFSVYCKNKNLIKEIGKFITLRNTTIHKIFNCNLKNLEIAIKIYYPKFYKLMENLVDFKINLLVNKSIR